MKILFDAESAYFKGEKLDNYFIEFIKMVRNILFPLFQDIKKAIRKCNTEESKKLSKDGYLIINDFINDNLCDKISDEINKLLVNCDYKNEQQINLENGAILSIRNGKTDKGMIDITNPHNEIIQIKELIKKSHYITRIINNTVYKPLKIKRTNAYINRNVNKTRLFHMDSPHINQYKVFIYLTDCKIKNGPYSYVQGSHRFNKYKYMNYINNFFRRSLQLNMCYYERKSVKRFVGKKGTCIISDQNGFHRGVPQARGYNRELIVLNYYD